MIIDFRDWQQRNEENKMSWYGDEKDKEIEENEERKNRQPLFEGGKQ